MRGRLLLLCWLLTFSALSAPQEFSADFPGTVHRLSSQKPPGVLYINDQPEIACTVNVFQAPRPLTPTEALHWLQSIGQPRLLVGKTLQPIASGLQLETTNSAGVPVSMRLFTRGAQVFVVGATGLDGQQRRRFLDSFRLPRDPNTGSP